MNDQIPKWACLHLHDDCSLLDGLSKPHQNLQRCIEIGISAAAITNHGTMSSVIEWIQAKKKVINKFKTIKEKTTDNKTIEELDKKIELTKNFKTILGVEMYIADNETKNSHLVVLAKNKIGYQSLIRAVSESTRKENFYRKPRLKLEQFDEYAKGNLITFSGHLGSALANILFLDIKEAYKARSVEEARSMLDPDHIKNAIALVDKYKTIFGKDFFYIEIQIFDGENIPAAIIVGETLRKIAKLTNTPAVATTDSHYANKSDAPDQRILLCNATNTTLPQIQKKLIEDVDDISFSGFFKSNNYYILSPQHMAALHTEEELANSIQISEQCEQYHVLSKPVVPTFPDTEGYTQKEYLRQLCRHGWKDKILNKIPLEKHSTYAERVKRELEVLIGAGLEGYFLILADIAKYVKSNNNLCGVGRGSAAGSIVSYLTGITALDPIEYDLLFERFYNAGRNTKDHISLPDIDFDVQASFRDQTIQYIKNKYGIDRVAGISTFGRMMGRGVIKDVLRAHEACSFWEMNEITKFIPDEAEIADQLQVMREEDGEAGIVLWALQNNSKELKDYVSIDEKTGEITGQYAKYFKQAIRLEGTKRSLGKHAAGIVISPTPLTDTFPLIYDRKTGEAVISFDMGGVESCGGLKLDILGLSILNKLKRSQEFLLKGCD